MSRRITTRSIRILLSIEALILTTRTRSVRDGFYAVTMRRFAHARAWRVDAEHMGTDSMAMASASGPAATAQVSEATRWGQLLFGIICMVMIANLQYGWTLFVNPIDQKYHWGKASIQVAFTIFVLT